MLRPEPWVSVADMPSLRRDPVRVLVPATSANLGPGFDTAGLALGVEDELTAMVSDDPGVLIEVEGEGAGELPTDATHLVARSMAMGFEAMGVRPAGFVLKCTNVIPHGRGMGSSAAAIIGGLALARALVESGDSLLSDADILRLALTVESHPDNVTAALHGGFTLAWIDTTGLPRHVRLDVHPAVTPVLLVPDDTVPTSKARTALPAQVDFADASFNIARSALLVHALTNEPALLMEATDDRLHQQARRSMYSASLGLVDRLRARGIAAAISGAGPSVIAFASADTVERVNDEVDSTWRVLRTRVAPAGAREVPIHP